jgi:hypothetical protein
MQMKIFFIKNCNLLMSNLQGKPSALKGEHPALQKMKFIKFFLCLWVIFAFLEPNPDCESGSVDPIESGSNPDPDPQHRKTVNQSNNLTFWQIQLAHLLIESVIKHFVAGLESNGSTFPYYYI